MRLVQLLNAYVPIEERVDFNVAVARSVHPSNAFAPTDTTFGALIDVSLAHPLNEFAFIVVVLIWGIDTSFEHPSKAEAPIFYNALFEDVMFNNSVHP